MAISFKNKFPNQFSAQDFSEFVSVHSGLVLTGTAADYFLGHCFEFGGLIADVTGISRHIFVSDLEIHIGLVR